jgi:gentisate 1,2-dioxygenase
MLKTLSEQTQQIGLFHEYLTAVNPNLPPIPAYIFYKDIYEGGTTRQIPLACSPDTKNNTQFTTPNCCPSFIRLNSQDTLELKANASSHFFYVISGKGQTQSSHGDISWQSGDVFVVPGTESLSHKAEIDAVLYYINDEPLLNYLKVAPVDINFRQLHFTKKQILDALDKVSQEKNANQRNRNGVLLGHPDCPETKTITPVLWVLFNMIDKNQVQKPHRHNSVALDFVIQAAEEGVYTLVSKAIDASGHLISPQRFDWQSGCLFITPPGYWHSHHNESGEKAFIMPVQDAGLHTYMRTLDIQFSQ